MSDIGEHMSYEYDILDLGKEKVPEKIVWIFDLEQLKNFHSATFMERDNPKNIRVFVIHSSRNDMHEYYKFLQEEVAGLIGFNNVRFDYPLMHLFMALMKMISENTTADGLNQILYEESQRLIREEYTAIPDKDTKIPQLDLFLIHHFDNKAKMTSLKYVEINIQYPNVQDMPFEHTHWVEDDEVEEILDYNFNDVDATYQFYIKSEKLVELRQKLGKRFNINILNANDPKIGQEIFGRELSRRTGIKYKVLKEMRTYRRSIDLGKCVLPSISFKSKEFNRILDFFKSKTIDTTYKAFEESVIYKGFKYDYGTGGLHGCIESGVYEEDEEYEIIDIDVQGYYPSIAIANGFYPQHLGKGFIQVYKEIVDLKNQAAKDGDMVTRAGMKLSGNGVYGKSNDQYSLFYDPMYTMRVTINGQLQLSMLAERLVDDIRIPITILQVNTDGITIKIHRDMEAKMLDICEMWEKHTGLVLEYARYKKMVIRDVNNYLAVTTDDVAKPKGCFEVIPMQNGAIAYNKNWSMRIVPKVLHEYYMYGVPVEEGVHDSRNIYDFTIGFRARGDWKIWATGLDKNIKFHDKQQKTLRY
ncbi:MAG: hypothetical protein ACTSQF_09130, partial [Candidatus Heimdallarchaeaceae archaeon]